MDEEDGPTENVSDDSRAAPCHSVVGRRAPGLPGPAAAAREIGVQTPDVYRR